MRRSVGTALLILTALIIQTTLLPHFALFRVVPDLLLDAPTGLSALAYLTVGYVVGAVRPYVQSSSVAVPLIGVFAGSVVGTAFYTVLALLLGVPAQPLARVAQVILLTGVYNTLLVPFAYPVVRRVAGGPPGSGRGGPRGEAVFPGRAA